MSSIKFTTQDRKDLEKFLKFLALKTVQVIVQSRLGERIKTKSKSYASGSDWFNLAIKDLPEVQAEAKKALSGQIPVVGFSMCTEISLKTVEGDTLVLETWVLGMDEQCDTSVRVTYAVYNRMSLLLKSLIAVARVTPAYKLSCRQGPDSYVICYRVYMGNPQYHLLGDGFQENKVGQVGTPVGTLTLTVAYRTRMTITPQRNEKESPIMVKSDYFKPDMSPKRPQRPIGSHALHFEFNPLEEVIPPCEGMKLINGEVSSPVQNGQQQQHHCHHPCPLNDVGSGEHKSWHSERNGEVQKNSLNCQLSLGESKKIGAFAPSTKGPDPSLLPDLLFPDTPFLSLLNNDSDNNPLTSKIGKLDGTKNADKNANVDTTVTNNRNGVDEVDRGVDYNCNASDTSHRSSLSEGSGYDDFVMVELKPPFAECDGNSDLGAFFRECQSAPPLVSFSSQPTLEEQVTEISCQLAMFETSMVDFDHFVDNICHSNSQK